MRSSQRLHTISLVSLLLGLNAYALADRQIPTLAAGTVANGTARELFIQDENSSTMRLAGSGVRSGERFYIWISNVDTSSFSITVKANKVVYNATKPTTTDGAAHAEAQAPLDATKLAEVDSAITADGDEMDVTVSFTKKSDAPAGTVVPTDMTAVIPVYGGFKIDYSSGYLVTSLVDFSYTTHQTPGTGVGTTPATYSVSGPTSAGYSTNNVTFMNFHFTDLGNINVALSLGVVAQSKPIYTVGGTITFGRTQRLALSAGLAFGEVARIVPGTGSTISTTTVPTYESYMGRPFLALTYNY